MPHSGGHLGDADRGSRRRGWVGWNLDSDDPEAVGILDPRLKQYPGLGRGFPDDRYSGRGQPMASRVVV